MINKCQAGAKLSLLKTIQNQFDKLQKVIGLPSKGSFTTRTSEPAFKKVKNDTAVNKQSAPTDNEDTTDQEESDETDNERQSETEEIMSNDKFTTTLSVQQLGIHQQYQHKASKLLFKITEHPDILKRNDVGEMVVFGKAEPGTNLNKLFKSMVGPTRDLNQPGIDKFFKALRRLGVRSNELSGKELQLK